MNPRHLSTVLAISLGTVASLAAAGFLSPRPASTCTPPQCTGGHLIPAGGTIPANASSIHWYPATTNDPPSSIDASHVDLMKVDGDSTTAVDIQIHESDAAAVYFAPTDGFDPDTTYRFRGANFCKGDGELGTDHDFEASFSTRGDASLPDTLGELTVASHQTGDLKVPTTAGSCHTTATADQVALELTHSDAAKPWSDLWSYHTEVRPAGTRDWSSWRGSHSLAESIPPGESWEGRARDRLYTLCQTDDSSLRDGLSPGSYDVRMTATLPGSDTSVTTPPLTIELTCQSQSDDTGSSDAGRPADTSSPSGCSTPDAPPTPAPLALLAILLATGLPTRSTTPRP